MGQFGSTRDPAEREDVKGFETARQIPAHKLRPRLVLAYYNNHHEGVTSSVYIILNIVQYMCRLTLCKA